MSAQPFEFFLVPERRSRIHAVHTVLTVHTADRAGNSFGTHSNFELVFVSRNPPDSCKEICYGDLVTEIL